MWCFFLIFRRFPAAILCVALLSSCASVSVKGVSRLDPDPPSRLPAKVFVAPFGFSDGEIRVDRSGADLENLKFNLRELMTRNLVRRLPKYVAPAEAVAVNAPLPRGNYWLIRGNFDRVYQGSRLLRSVVGLGAGATLMDTTVVVYDLSGPHPAPFLRIATTGGSNISPGIGGVATIFVSGPMALTSLFNVVDGVRSGITFDAIRTTREVNAALSEYLYQRGAIPYAKAAGPKRLGEFPNRIGPPDRAKMKGSLSVVPAAQDRQ
ncbi:MAG: DUF4410 domain-containing protein [Terrimicrobiaceae bacterium]